MSLSAETAVCTTSLVLRILLLLASGRIVYKEFINRKVNGQKQKDQQNMYQKLLSIFSITSMIMVVITLTFHILSTFKESCVIGVSGTLIFYCASRILLTYFQISRLQYCFSETQIHSKYGYPRWWFIVLYLGGTLVLMYSTFCGLYVFAEKWHYTKFGDYFFCFGENEEQRYTIINPIGFAAFILWDWTVIICYIVKICQFYKKNESEDVHIDQRVTKRIKFILYKITFLTFLIETLSISSTTLGPILAATFRDNLYASVIANFLLACENLGFVYIVYHMMDHNNEEYLRVMRKVNKKGLCCCFKSSFMDVVLQRERNDTVMTRSDAVDDKREVGRVKTIETNTLVNLPRALPTQQSQPSMQLYD